MLGHQGKSCVFALCTERSARGTHDVGGAGRQQRRQQRVQLAQLVAAGDGVQQVVADDPEPSAAAAVRTDVVQLRARAMLNGRRYPSTRAHVVAGLQECV